MTYKAKINNQVDFKRLENGKKLESAIGGPPIQLLTQVDVA
jgi:hypothetical protein